MRTVHGAIALFAVAGIIGISGPVLAADPAQSDFDACNREAQSANPARPWPPARAVASARAVRPPARSALRPPGR